MVLLFLYATPQSTSRLQWLEPIVLSVYSNISQLVNMRTNRIVVGIRMNRAEWSFVRLYDRNQNLFCSPSVRVTFSGFPTCHRASRHTPHNSQTHSTFFRLRAQIGPENQTWHTTPPIAVNTNDSPLRGHRIRNSCVMCREEKSGGNRCVWLDCVRDIFEWRGWTRLPRNRQQRYT